MLMSSNTLDLNIFEQRFHSLFHQAPFSAALLTGPTFIVEMANAISLQLWGKDSSIIGKPLLEAIPEIKDQKVFHILTEVFRTGKTYDGKEHTAFLVKDGKLTTIYVNLVYKAIRDNEGNITGVFAVGYDVTDQVNARKKLEESEERFRTLITETPEVGAALYLGREIRVQYVNEVMLQFWGKDNSIIGKPLAEALPELQGQPFFEQLDKVFTSGVAFTGREVKAVLEREGKLEASYYNYTYKPLRNITGEIYAIHHMAVDVTDHVISNLKLVESEKEVSNLFEQTPVGIATFKGSSFIVERVNETLLSYWGRTRKDVLNKPAFDALPELRAQGVEEIAREVYKSGKPYTSPDTPLTLLKNGQEEQIIVRFGFQAIKDWQGTVTGILAIANDVTDLVNARYKVEKNETRLRLMADSMPQVVWIAGENGLVTYYNKRVLEFAGASQNKDGTWNWGGILHPDDLTITSEAWNYSVRERLPYQMEHRVLMSNGTYRWHLSRAYAHETDEGIRWFGTATDVHDQKILEMNLETIVKERTLELQRSNEDLQQFAHVASHDLKEPVRKIKTFSHKLQDEYKHVLGERGNSFVNRIIHATDRMNAMINGVLNYASTPSIGQVVEPVDLNNVMETVQSDLEILIQEKKTTITYSQLPTITGIKELIHQLFYNLLNNSLKFSKTTSDSFVSVTSSEVNNQGKLYYKIVFKDNGIGFEQEYAEQIFTSFYRLNSKDQYEGSGLGLALCKKIVERHGGSITARGEKGNGAEFEILLPK